MEKCLFCCSVPTNKPLLSRPANSLSSLMVYLGHLGDLIGREDSAYKSKQSFGEDYSKPNLTLTEFVSFFLQHLSDFIMLAIISKEALQMSLVHQQDALPRPQKANLPSHTGISQMFRCKKGKERTSKEGILHNNQPNPSGLQVSKHIQKDSEYQHTYIEVITKASFHKLSATHHIA